MYRWMYRSVAARSMAGFEALAFAPTAETFAADPSPPSLIGEADPGSGSETLALSAAIASAASPVASSSAGTPVPPKGMATKESTATISASRKSVPRSEATPRANAPIRPVASFDRSAPSGRRDGGSVARQPQYRHRETRSFESASGRSQRGQAWESVIDTSSSNYMTGPTE